MTKNPESKQTKVSKADITEALATLTLAIMQKAKFLAPVGMDLVRVEVLGRNEGNRWTDLSTHRQNEKSAKRALVNWVLEDYVNNDPTNPRCIHDAPDDWAGWDLNKEVDYRHFLKIHSDQQIIDEYFEDNGEREYTIESVLINPLEARRPHYPLL
jgi:hypothetical protein